MQAYPTAECPQCSQQFTRDESGARDGYSLLGQGDTLSLIRCQACGTELPVPETTTASLTVAATDDDLALRLRLSR